MKYDISKSLSSTDLYNEYDEIFEGLYERIEKNLDNNESINPLESGVYEANDGIIIKYNQYK